MAAAPSAPVEGTDLPAGGRVFTVGCAAPPTLVWPLLATPARWREWAPHILAVSDAEGAADAVVRAGQVLRVQGPAPLPLRAEVTRVVDGRRWDVRVNLPGPYAITRAHLLVPEGPAEAPASRIVVHAAIRGPLAGLLATHHLLAYEQLLRRSVLRLARLAEAAAGT